MLVCLPTGEDSEHILLKFFFLPQLPADVQDHLTHSTALTICVLAEQADAYFALSSTQLNQPSILVGNIDVAAIDCTCTRLKHSIKNDTRQCYYHVEYGTEVRRCTQNNCQMAHVHLAKTLPVGNTNTGHQ